MFDTAGLPGKLIDVTQVVSPEVRPYLAGRIGGLLPGNKAWFRLGNDKFSLIDLGGDPSQWYLARTIDLPSFRPMRFTERGPNDGDPRHGFDSGVDDIKPLKTEGLFVFLIIDQESMRLQVLDVRGGGTQWHPPCVVSPRTRSLNVLGDFAYLTTVPDGAGNECVVRPFQGQRFKIYNLSNPAQIKYEGEWAPSQPNRAWWLYPSPEDPRRVAVLEARMGFGFHVADFSDPVHPRVLSHVATNGGGSGYRVAVWGDRAMYSCSLKATLYDVSDPRSSSPKELGSYQTFDWLRVLHLYQDTAIVAGYDGVGHVLDLRDPKNPKVVSTVSCDAAWGTRIYGFKGFELVASDVADPTNPQILSRTKLSVGGFDGAWADGPYLYAVARGKSDRSALLVIWDVSDPKSPKELSRFQHPEFKIERGSGYWTAHGRVLAESRGIVLVTSYHAGAPQVIDARNPQSPRFLGCLVTKRTETSPFYEKSDEYSDCFPDGPYFYVKSPMGPVEGWDLSEPEKPRLIWEEPGEGPFKNWVAGVPTGEVLLAPKSPHLKLFTIPRPSQVPAGVLTWAQAERGQGSLGIGPLRPGADGSVIQGVVPGGPAQKAGLVAGDILRKIGRDEIKSNQDAAAIIGSHQVGEEVEVLFERDGKEHKLTIKFGPKNYVPYRNNPSGGIEYLSDKEKVH